MVIGPKCKEQDPKSYIEHINDVPCSEDTEEDCLTASLLTVP